MSLINTFVFTRTVIDWPKLAQATGNCFRVVAIRDYKDKKGILPDGVTMTLTVLRDTMDYGIDKKSGKPRDNNVYQNFDVTVLKPVTVKKGDKVRLLDFDEEHSYAIGFDLLLRFKDCEVLPVGSKNDA